MNKLGIDKTLSKKGARKVEGLKICLIFTNTLRIQAKKTKVLKKKVLLW